MLSLSPEELTALHGAYVAGNARVAVEKLDLARRLMAREEDNTESTTHDQSRHRQTLAAAATAASARQMMARACLALDRMINVYAVAPDIITMNAFIKALCAVGEAFEGPGLIKEAMTLFSAMSPTLATESGCSA